MADDAFLSLQNLSVWYKAGQPVLRGCLWSWGAMKLSG